jgi:hypothetical protein
VIVNWFLRLSILDFDSPTITDSSIRHQTDIFQSEAIAVVSSTSIIDLAFVFHSDKAVAKKLNIHGIGNAFILRYRQTRNGFGTLNPDTECLHCPSYQNDF